MSPQRIQRHRIRGWRMPQGALYVGRPSKWGNPFISGEPYRFFDATGNARMGIAGGPSSCRDLFADYIAARTDLHEEIRHELGGHDLACWCPVGSPCHGDVLLEIASGGAS